MEDYYNSHWIRTDDQGRIIAGFSDAFEPPQDGDICINSEGGYQFRLYPGGAENPPLRDEYGVPLYKWDGEVIARAQQEIEDDRPEPVEPQDDMAEVLAILRGERDDELWLT